jgi:hypothetical protein
VILAAAAYFLCEMLLDVDTVSDATDATSAVSTHGACIAKLKNVSWGKLRTPTVVLQILTQFVSITGLQLPALYKVRLVVI